jgi:quinol monooxygenase YgiN
VLLKTPSGFLLVDRWGFSFFKELLGIIMYCLAYEFFVDKYQEHEFKRLWHQLTLMIKEDNGSLGARLHKVIDVENTWVAYAQWESEKVYEHSLTDAGFEKLREQFLHTCKGIKILYQLEVIDDMLM